jgi:transposase-like protein
MTYLPNVDISDIITMYKGLSLHNVHALIEQTMENLTDSYLEKNNHEKLDDGKARFIRYGYKPSSYTCEFGVIENLQTPRIRDRLYNTEVFFLEDFKGNHENSQLDLMVRVFVLYIYGFSYAEISQYFATVYKITKGYSTKNIGNIIQEYITKYYENDSFYDCIFPMKYMALYIDATYVKTQGGILTCILATVGITVDGEYKLLNLKKALDNNETEESYLDLFNQLKDKGLESPDLIVADGATAIWAAASKVFPNSLQQPCWIHKCRNVFKAIAKSRWQVIGDKFKLLFDAETKEEAESILNKLIEEEFASTKKVKNILTDNRDILFNYFKFPKNYRTSLYTSNPVETVFSLLKPRAKATRGMMGEDRMLFVLRLMGTKCNSVQSLADLIIGNFEFVRNQKRVDTEPIDDSKINRNIYDLIVNNESYAQTEDIIMNIGTQLVKPGENVFKKIFTVDTEESKKSFAKICNKVVKDKTRPKNPKNNETLKKVGDDIQTTGKKSKKTKKNNDSKKEKDKKDLATETSNKKPSEDKADQTEKNKQESTQVNEYISVSSIHEYFLMNILKTTQNTSEFINTKQDEETLKILRKLINKRKKYLFKNKDFITKTDDWYYIKKIE